MEYLQKTNGGKMTPQRKLKIKQWWCPLLKDYCNSKCMNFQHTLVMPDTRLHRNLPTDQFGFLLNYRYIRCTCFDKRSTIEEKVLEEK